MNRKIFNKIYAKFFKKDYFGDKLFIRNEITGLKQDRRPLPSLKQIKGYLRNQKEKCVHPFVTVIDDEIICTICNEIVPQDWPEQIELKERKQ